MAIYKPQDCKSTTTQPRQKTTLISTEELQPWDLQMTIFSCLLQDKLAKFLQTERPLFWENMPNVRPYPLPVRVKTVVRKARKKVPFVKATIPLLRKKVRLAEKMEHITKGNRMATILTREGHLCVFSDRKSGHSI